MRYILLDLYGKLLKALGPQHWWPAETVLEVIVGAVLTQNTAWSNVEKAIKNLKSDGWLTFEGLEHLPTEQLAELIRPAGYYNIKAARLKNLIRLLRETCGGDVKRLCREEAMAARTALLSVSGVGPETADSILLYAADHPIFVIDTYTCRILSRHDLLPEGATYEDAQRLFMEHLPHQVPLFKEYHALFVRLGKDFCRKRNPRCGECPLGPEPT